MYNVVDTVYSTFLSQSLDPRTTTTLVRDNGTQQSRLKSGRGGGFSWGVGGSAKKNEDNNGKVPPEHFASASKVARGVQYVCVVHPPTSAEREN